MPVGICKDRAGFVSPYYLRVSTGFKSTRDSLARHLFGHGFGFMELYLPQVQQRLCAKPSSLRHFSSSISCMNRLIGYDVLS